MNNIISIDGLVSSSVNEKSGGGVRIDTGGSIKASKASRLRQALESTLESWNSLDTFCDPIVSLRYIRIVPKSLRMSELLKQKGKSVERTIVGASYDTSGGTEKHVIVYRLPVSVLEEGIYKLRLMEKIISNLFQGSIDKEVFSNIAGTKVSTTEDEKEFRKAFIHNLAQYRISINTFLALAQDIFYIDDIYIETNPGLTAASQMLVSFYDTGMSREELLSKLNLSRGTPVLGSDGEGFAYSLDEAQIKSIAGRYPYLVSMGALQNLNETPVFTASEFHSDPIAIPDPADEPVVGVIDGAFDTTSYFSSWVEYQDHGEGTDKRHGTAVSSLIVDGPSLNPDLEDGCGRFRVRHFSVMSDGDRINQFALYHQIESIITRNSSIKVWNLSLGTIQEIDMNSVSPMAALLDRLQSERDVIFVVSGTNNDDMTKKQPYIGSPADSINSVVVNAVKKDGRIPDYARRGPVLSFYLCPDLCAVGGSREDSLKVCTGKQLATAYGTSYAACWVTRKLAYLIHYLKFTKEEAKALLVDAAYGWQSGLGKDCQVKGCGILPQHINSIITTPEDEVKLIVKGTCDKYRTYSYYLNLPLDSKGKFPYYAKATLCYFPQTSRKQGVDYAQTEIDIHFGRLNGDLSLKPINGNRQSDSGKVSIYENEARQEFQKWGCTKHICELIPKRPSSKKVLFERKKESKTDQPWGFFLLKKKRSPNIDDNPNFALVLTFKSTDANNYYNDFLRILRYTGWYAQPIEASLMHEVYSKSLEELEFND